MTTLIILFIISLWVALFYNIFKYFRVRAGSMSKDEIARAANEEARTIEYRDPIITCDYCGNKIDTRTQRVCPACGGAYDKDEEWLKRFEVSDDFIEDKTRRLISLNEKESIKKGQKALEEIKIVIKALAIVHAIIAVIVVAVLVISAGDEYAKNETVNEYANDNYVLADYKVDGDGVLFEDENVKVTITGFYVDDYQRKGDDYGYTGSVKAEIKVENRLDQPVRVSIRCDAVSGIVSDISGFNIFENFKKKSETVLYKEMHYVPHMEVSELVFSEISIYSKDYEYQKEVKCPFTIKTTSGYMCIVNTDSYNCIYSDEKMDIYYKYDEGAYDSGYRLYIKNKTDDAYEFKASDMTIDGKEVYTYGLDEVVIPSGYMYVSGIVYSSDESFDDRDNKTVQISFSFNCKEDPSKSFSTPYLDL